MDSTRDCRDVRTVFHEHGHALQFMLTEQTDYFVAGTNGIPEDAVEEPSQFMEFWSALSQCAWLPSLCRVPCHPCSTCGRGGQLFIYSAQDVISQVQPCFLP